MLRVNFTRQQWLTCLTFVVVNFCNAMCVSMQVKSPAEGPISRQFFTKKLHISGTILSPRSWEEGLHAIRIWPCLWNFRTYGVPGQSNHWSKPESNGYEGRLPLRTLPIFMGDALNLYLFFQLTLNVGIGTVGVTSILFGLLDKIEDGKIFLALSFTLRLDLYI